MLGNGFPTVLGLVRNYLGRILKGPKWAEFDEFSGVRNRPIFSKKPGL